ncbi:hypothetical protein H696_02967 [Fonticula alba]|uniref:Uncharacterized protein n=1 Tax=Fonticula alba TaxID=691883 RepID=A0A058Z8N2_FONAL|nr:hypothetical protein H696_02967 [Fonticula alba]KCV70610.1 hypothetical protein H696_02967 [Fonticula alba]|eukprot:XP_009495126.1 hypothetical protein H696_02967 [Fonticula alba]
MLFRIATRTAPALRALEAAAASAARPASMVAFFSTVTRTRPGDRLIVPNEPSDGNPAPLFPRPDSSALLANLKENAAPLPEGSTPAETFMAKIQERTLLGQAPAQSDLLNLARAIDSDADLALFDEAIHSFRVRHQTINIQTGGALAKALIRINQPLLMFKYFKNPSKYTLYPSFQDLQGLLYRLAIDCRADPSLLPRCFEAFRMMRRQYTPNVTTFSLLIRACLNANTNDSTIYAAEVFFYPSNLPCLKPVGENLDVLLPIIVTRLMAIQDVEPKAAPLLARLRICTVQFAQFHNRGDPRGAFIPESLLKIFKITLDEIQA